MTNCTSNALNEYTTTLNNCSKMHLSLQEKQAYPGIPPGDPALHPAPALPPQLALFTRRRLTLRKRNTSMDEQKWDCQFDKIEILLSNAKFTPMNPMKETQNPQRSTSRHPRDPGSSGEHPRGYRRNPWDTTWRSRLAPRHHPAP